MAFPITIGFLHAAADAVACTPNRQAGDRRSPSPSGRITLGIRVIIASFFDHHRR